MTAENARKYNEYIQIAERFLEVARKSSSRSVRMRKRVEAAEWVKRAEAIPDKQTASLRPPKAEAQRT